MSWGNSPRNGVSVAISNTVSFRSALPIPSLDLNFVAQGIAGALDPRITFARASTATYTGSDGLIKTAAINTPRFDYNPTTLQPKGLLIEEQRTNLLTYSEQFDNANWAKASVAMSVTANTSVAPDGTITADTLTKDAFGYRFFYQVFTATAGTNYTASFYLKQGTLSKATIMLSGDGGTTSHGRVVFDFVAKTATNAASTALIAKGITELANGWFLCYVTATLVTNTSPRVFLYPDLYINNTAGSILAWGAQLEAGSFPTSYIPTVASQVTRSADSASMTGTNFSSWYRADEGSIYSEIQPFGVVTGKYGRTYAISDGTANNAIRALFDSAAQHLFQTYAGGSVQANINAGTPTNNAIFKRADTYKVNDFAASVNGAAAGVDTTAVVPAVNTLFIGSENSANYVNGTIKRIAYYPKRLSNSQLQAITK